MSYALSRFNAVRRPTREVSVGGVGIGGGNPIRFQSMTTTNTLDVAGTVAQCIRLAEAGSELIRITAPTVEAARALREIHRAFREAGFSQPLVADIHFLPAAAMEAIEHVEKVRINPGNYADRRSAFPRDYTDAEYAAELERVAEAVSPLIRRAKTLGRAIRIGTNHGSLSERTLNRFGDTPAGMVEAAMEFVRICEAEGFYDLVLSMKSSNVRVMIEAYRLAVKTMRDNGMNYPVHLGVTEAGEGEDARIKSAVGIGSLLLDGIGDTIRVSLTEDPWRELPACREIASRIEKICTRPSDPNPVPAPVRDTDIEAFSYRRRKIVPAELGSGVKISSDEPPRVFAFIDAEKPLADTVAELQTLLDETRGRTPVEGLVLPMATESDLAAACEIQAMFENEIPAFVFDPVKTSVPSLFEKLSPSKKSATYIQRRFNPANAEIIPDWIALCRAKNIGLVVDATAGARAAVIPALEGFPQDKLIFTSSRKSPDAHPVGVYRKLAQMLANAGILAPIWIRSTVKNTILPLPKFGGGNDARVEASLLAGSLLCDGIGDVLSVELSSSPARNVALAYDILQAARSRRFKTEYIACPSCGRTQYDIQETVKKIKERTGHLSGVTIGVMGCIVNGPGEMADADFGYVGGAPGRINLYVRKECVARGIPQEEAVERLIELIKKHGKWKEKDESRAA